MNPQNIHNFFTPSAFKAGILSTLLCSIVYFFSSTGQPAIFTSLDNQIIDFMFHLRGTEDSSGSVVIVDIDEKSLKKYGQWPWPRDLVGKLTEKILAAQPAVIGFDIMFSERDRTSPTSFFQYYQPREEKKFNNESLEFKNLFSSVTNYDDVFGKILEKSNSVQGYRFLFREDFLNNSDQLPQITHNLVPTPPLTSFDKVQLIEAYRPILNIPELRTGGVEGFINLFHNGSGAVRKTPLFLLFGGVPYPSLVLEMLQKAHPETRTGLLLNSQMTGKYYPVRGVSFGDQFFRTDTYGQININFRGPSNTFLYLSASDVLNDTEASFLAGKYVLIGSTASGVIDLISTPFSSRMPGVEVHANILDNLIQNDALIWNTELEKSLSYLVILMAGLIISASLVFLSPLLGLSLCFTTFFSLAAGNYYFLFLQHNLIGFSYVFAALIVIFIVVALCNYFFEGKKKLFIKRAFSHYVSPAVVSELLKYPEKLDLQVDTREVSILFCDIRDFTTLAENTSPAELSVFLNSYFSLLTDIIIKHNGMVDKYIGDAIMAVWGTPLEDTDHASNAVRAALEMVEASHQQREKLTLAGQAVRIGIGINSGSVSAGNFGCSRRFDYTVLGDNVNLASRIEGLTKYYPTNVLITEFTHSLLQLPTACRYVDSVQVKGRLKPVDIFEPLSPDKTKEIGELEYFTFHKALEYYRNAEFKQANALFNQLFTSHKDPLYQLYQQRCLKLLKNPPTEKWCGIYYHN